MSVLDPWTRLVPGVRVAHRSPHLQFWHGTVARDDNGYAWTWIQQPLGGVVLVFVEWDHMERGQWYVSSALMEERKWTEEWRASR